MTRTSTQPEHGFTAHDPVTCACCAANKILSVDLQRAVDALATVYAILKTDFGGWWVSAPSDEPLGKVRDLLYRTLRESSVRPSE